MRSISKDTITEKVKDVIYETGLLSPRSAITTKQRFSADYGLEDGGAIAAFTARLNTQFRPYGITVSRDEMAACERVSNLITLLVNKGNKPTSGLFSFKVSKFNAGNKIIRRTQRRES